jgi:6-pyruvoyltetrahydropterin/6-carboxytetrahydropterin synthase
VGVFRIAKRFHIESGHRLAKHPDECRFPHGHSRTIEVVLSADRLDDHDMVCDYKALKTVVAGELERYDHAMLLWADDPERDAFLPFAQRVVLIEDGDPTTEVLARVLFRAVSAALGSGGEVKTGGASYRIPAGVRLERVRVWETATAWAEYGEEPDTPSAT